MSSRQIDAIGKEIQNLSLDNIISIIFYPFCQIALRYEKKIFKLIEMHLDSSFVFIIKLYIKLNLFDKINNLHYLSELLSTKCICYWNCKDRKCSFIVLSLKITLIGYELKKVALGRKCFVAIVIVNTWSTPRHSISMLVLRRGTVVTKGL